MLANSPKPSPFTRNIPNHNPMRDPPNFPFPNLVEGSVSVFANVITALQPPQRPPIDLETEGKTAGLLSTISCAWRREYLNWAGGQPKVRFAQLILDCSLNCCPNSSNLNISTYQQPA